MNKRDIDEYRNASNEIKRVRRNCAMIKYYTGKKSIPFNIQRVDDNPVLTYIHKYEKGLSLCIPQKPFRTMVTCPSCGKHYSCQITMRDIMKRKYAFCKECYLKYAHHLFRLEQDKDFIKYVTADKYKIFKKEYYNYFLYSAYHNAKTFQVDPEDVMDKSLKRLLIRLCMTNFFLDYKKAVRGYIAKTCYYNAMNLQKTKYRSIFFADLRPSEQAKYIDDVEWERN